MKKGYYSLIFCLFFMMNSCDTTKSNSEIDGAVVDNAEVTEIEAEEEVSTLLSFAFVGCNRVDRHDQHKHAATDGSTANLSALKRIYTDIVFQGKICEKLESITFVVTTLQNHALYQPQSS